MRSWSLLVAAVMLPPSAHAEDGKLDMSFESRLRIESIRGNVRADAPTDDAAIFLRTSLRADYDAGPIRLTGELLDSRAYFEKPDSSVGVNEVNAVEPLQAFVATDISDHAQLIAGRFSLNLGSRRLIARNNYRNAINGFTGAQTILGDAKRDSALLFWMAAQTRLPDEREAIRRNAVELDRERGSPRLFGAYLSRKRSALTIDAYAIRLTEHDLPDIATRDRRLWTAGARLLAPPTPGKIDGDVEAAWQWGHARETTTAIAPDRRVRAGFVHAAAGYTFAVAWRPRIALAFDYASGDGRGPTYSRFDTLYGARVFDFAPSGLYGATTRANIISPEFRLEAQPERRTDTFVGVRPLWLASSSDAFATTGVRDARGASGRYAGTQIDARVRHTLVPDRLRLSVGATGILNGRFLNRAPNAADTGNTLFAFTEMTATF